VGIFRSLPGPVLAGVGFVLGSQAGMLSIAMTAHGGWAALAVRVIGLAAFSIGSVALINRGMRETGQRRFFPLGLGVGAALGAFFYWLLVPYEIVELFR
jgi:ABC-type enterobactin transport system permease subunit